MRLTVGEMLSDSRVHHPITVQVPVTEGDEGYSIAIGYQYVVVGQSAVSKQTRSSAVASSSFCRDEHTTHIDRAYCRIQKTIVLNIAFGHGVVSIVYVGSGQVGSLSERAFRERTRPHRRSRAHAGVQLRTAQDLNRTAMPCNRTYIPTAARNISGPFLGPPRTECLYSSS